MERMEPHFSARLEVFVRPERPSVSEPWYEAHLTRDDGGSRTIGRGDTAREALLDCIPQPPTGVSG